MSKEFSLNVRSTAQGHMMNVHVEVHCVCVYLPLACNFKLSSCYEFKMIYFYTEVQFSSSPRLDLVLSFPSVAAVLCLLSILRENMDIYIYICVSALHSHIPGHLCYAACAFYSVDFFYIHHFLCTCIKYVLE